MFLLLAAAGGVFIVESCKNEYVEQAPVCFERDVFPIISSSCTQSSCHNSLDQVADRDYSTYDGILRDVQKGNYQASKLYQIVAASGATMPPKPYNLLSESQILTLATWIAQGAGNDTCSLSTTCDTTSVISFTGQVQPLLVADQRQTLVVEDADALGRQRLGHCPMQMLMSANTELTSMLLAKLLNFGTLNTIDHTLLVYADSATA